MSEPSANKWVANESLLFRMRNRRHTAARHLLCAGVDINTIRAWLDHVSIDVTNIYAETVLEMKGQGTDNL